MPVIWDDLDSCDIRLMLLHCILAWWRYWRYWPFVWGIQRSPVNSPHKGQWRVALMFSLIYAWINDWVNNREAGDLFIMTSLYFGGLTNFCRFYRDITVSLTNDQWRWQLWSIPQIDFLWLSQLVTGDQLKEIHNSLNQTIVRAPQCMTGHWSGMM